MQIRDANRADAGDLARIYNHYVLNSCATFDTRAVSIEERRDWVDEFDPNGRHRLLVATEQATVIGFASSAHYREHSAFDRTVELSIYVDHEAVGRGTGTALYRSLFEHIQRQPIDVTLAGIALPNEASVALHRRFGFTDIGQFTDYAVKWGRSISSLWMERVLN